MSLCNIRVYNSHTIFLFFLILSIYPFRKTFTFPVCALNLSWNPLLYCHQKVSFYSPIPENSYPLLESSPCLVGTRTETSNTCMEREDQTRRDLTGLDSDGVSGYPCSGCKRDPVPSRPQSQTTSLSLGGFVLPETEGWTWGPRVLEAGLACRGLSHHQTGLWFNDLRGLVRVLERKDSETFTFEGMVVYRHSEIYLSTLRVSVGFVSPVLRNTGRGNILLYPRSTGKTDVVPYKNHPNVYHLKIPVRRLWLILLDRFTKVEVNFDLG